MRVGCQYEDKDGGFTGAKDSPEIDRLDEKEKIGCLDVVGIRKA